MFNSEGECFRLHLKCSVTIWRQILTHIVDIPHELSLEGTGTEG